MLVLSNPSLLLSSDLYFAGYFFASLTEKETSVALPLLYQYNKV